MYVSNPSPRYSFKRSRKQKTHKYFSSIFKAASAGRNLAMQQIGARQKCDLWRQLWRDLRSEIIDTFPRRALRTIRWAKKTKTEENVLSYFLYLAFRKMCNQIYGNSKPTVGCLGLLTEAGFDWKGVGGLWGHSLLWSWKALGYADVSISPNSLNCTRYMDAVHHVGYTSTN